MLYRNVRKIAFLQTLVPLLQRKHVLGQRTIQIPLRQYNFERKQSSQLNLLNHYQICLLLKQKNITRLNSSFLKFQQQIAFPNADYSQQAKQIADIRGFHHNQNIGFVFLKLYLHQKGFMDVEDHVVKKMAAFGREYPAILLEPDKYSKFIGTINGLLNKVQTRLACQFILNYEQQGITRKIRVNPFDELPNQKRERQSKAKPFYLKLNQSKINQLSKYLHLFAFLNRFSRCQKRIKFICQTIYSSTDLTQQQQLILLTSMNIGSSVSIGVLRKLQQTVDTTINNQLFIEKLFFLCNNSSQAILNERVLQKLKPSNSLKAKSIIARLTGQYQEKVVQYVPKCELHQVVDRILKASRFEYQWIKINPFSLYAVKFSSEEYLLPILSRLHAVGDKYKPEVEWWMNKTKQLGKKVYFIKDDKLQQTDGYFNRKRLINSILKQLQSSKIKN